MTRKVQWFAVGGVALLCAAIACQPQSTGGSWNLADVEDVEEEIGTADVEDGGADTGFEAGMCFVDFPCELAAACDSEDPKGRFDFTTIPCEEVCGHSNCSGAVCNVGGRDCGSGEVCVGGGGGDEEVRAECASKSSACGGPDEQTCGEGEFCEYGGAVVEDGAISDPPDPTIGCDVRDAGLYGRCVEVPDSCSDEFDPVCGCDGTTYDNDCARKRAGVPRKSRGECGE